MLHDFAEPLTVVIGRSRRLAWVLAAIHALALAAAVLTEIGWLLKTAIVFAVIASAVVSFRRHVYIASTGGAETAVVALREQAGEYSVRVRGGTGFVPVTLSGFTVLPFALLLEVKAAAWRRSRAAIVFYDAVDADAFHHLRARLRLRGHRQASVETPSKSL